MDVKCRKGQEKILPQSETGSYRGHNAQFSILIGHWRPKTPWLSLKARSQAWRTEMNIEEWDETQTVLELKDSVKDRI